MKKQLLTIINAKLKSLRSQNNTNSQQTCIKTDSKEESKQYTNSERDEHSYRNEDEVQDEANDQPAIENTDDNNPIIPNNESIDEHEYQEVDEDMRDSSSLPVPVQNTFHNND